jgi:lysophospholipase L1-like esterase
MVLVLVAGTGAAFVVWWLGPRSEEGGPPDHGGRPVAAFIGDSYTAGFASSTPERRWTSLVAKKEGWRELNFGEAGSGYITQGFGGTSYLGRVDKVIAAHPDIVFVAGGQNDINTNGDIVAAVQATLLRLREGLPDAKMYVLGPTWTAAQPAPRLLEIQTAAQEAATAVHARFIPALDVLAGRTDLIAPDNIHPNDAGHQAIADRVIAALR